ncbi:hypothetical protein NVP1278O_74 [Vibrio phage 1.278.O._10N.286.54.E8]|nr:hypothetical protein NVP1278O_74 [Vibrio phage 1.278.O._10N.286.54.E8]
MTTYNTYQEAKIANPDSDIYFIDNKQYRTGEWIDQYNFGRSSFVLCNPADHCMTAEKFLTDGHKFSDGDLVYTLYGSVVKVCDSKPSSGAFYYTSWINIKIDESNKIYILRAAALESIPTETPEEKEVLDGIESAGEIEWSGDGLPPVGDIVTIRYNFDSKTVTHTGVVKYASSKYCILDDGDGGEFSYNICDYVYEKPETPQQRKDRERACAIYDMCAEADIFTEESNFWAGKFYDLGYTKEKTHGTN